MKVGIWNSKTLEEQDTDVLEEVKSENQLIVFNFWFLGILIHPFTQYGTHIVM